MLPKRLRSLTTPLVLPFLLTFGACSITSDFTGIDSMAEPEAAAQVAQEDPDLSPVAVEPEISLDQELQALQRAGSWDNPRHKVEQHSSADSADTEVTYDFPITINRQVEVYLDLFQGKQRAYFSRWLARSSCFLPLIQAELKEAGLPSDLAYLSMIESGFSQRAYSRAKAVGLWQFMAATGRDYGLDINSYLDERRDAEKSTKAAVAYLSDLYAEFGDWYLAVAAYNGGPGTMRRAISKTGSTDFWKIAQQKFLHLETKRYVPKLIAAIIIAKQPEKYGFSEIDYEPALAFDTINVGPGLSLEAAALLANSSSKQLKSLNQELTTGKTPLDCESYALKIPAGTRELAERNLPRLHSYVSTDFKTHVVGKGETLAKVCRTYNINTTTLLKVNKLRSSQLTAGTRLRIPFRTVQYRILPEGSEALIASGSDLILHTIKKGDTISKISKQYQVPPELIVAWNGLGSVHKIRAGQQLALYIIDGPTQDAAPELVAASIGSAPEGSDKPVLSESRKISPLAKKADDAYNWYLVKNGDTLWTISRRFNTSPTDIKRLNKLKSNLIHPGNRLKLKGV